MLLPLLLNLGFAAGVVVTPPPTPPPIIINKGGGGSGSITYYQPQIRKHENENIKDYDYQKDQIADSEIIVIIEMTLKHFII